MAKPLNLIVAQPYPVIEIAKPDDCVVVFDRTVSLESKTMTDGLVVTIALFVVRKSSC